jgi:hypothetical protein
VSARDIHRDAVALLWRLANTFVPYLPLWWDATARMMKRLGRLKYSECPEPPAIKMMDHLRQMEGNA